MRPSHDPEKLMATIIILESELRQARDTVEFLHNCLTNKQYSYGHPDQTVKHLEVWNYMLPQREPCPHSFAVVQCEACISRITAAALLTWAKNILGGE